MNDKDAHHGQVRSGIVSAFLNIVFNSLLAFILLLLCMPIFLIIALVIYLQKDGPVFYRGTRLGLHKKPFRMLKFRTLTTEAEKVVGAQLLSLKIDEHKKLETWSGRFLRNTHLDELPQLFNLLKGDMDLVGPRPIRPEIYEKMCRMIRDYDVRFTVKPGLVGFSQLLFVYNCPKRLQSFIDNRFARKKQNILWNVSFVLYAFFFLGFKMFRLSLKMFWVNIVKGKLLGHFKEQRVFPRIEIDEAFVVFQNVHSSTGEPVIGKIVNLNEEAFLLSLGDKIPDSKSKMVFTVRRRRKKKRIEKFYTATCEGTVFREGTSKNGAESKFMYVIKYQPLSQFQSYKFHQYFLMESTM